MKRVLLFLMLAIGTAFLQDASACTTAIVSAEASAGRFSGSSATPTISTMYSVKSKEANMPILRYSGRPTLSSGHMAESTKPVSPS